MKFTNQYERDDVIRAIISQFPGISPSLVDEIIKDMGYKRRKKLRSGHNYPQGVQVKHDGGDLVRLYCDDTVGQPFGVMGLEKLGIPSGICNYRGLKKELLKELSKDSDLPIEIIQVGPHKKYMIRTAKTH